MKKLRKNGDFQLFDNVYLFNNLWGEQNGAGVQSSWVTSYEKTHNCITWNTSWDWSNDESSIKSYASIVYGWHWGWKLRESEFPIRVEDIREIRTSWEFNVKEKRNGNLNVTYDLWFSNTTIANENPDGELMIWIHKTGAVPPIGTVITEMEISGATWKLWKGLHPEHNWPVFSFIRKENVNEVRFDINEFIKELRNNEGFSIKYLLSVQSGIEVLSGSGTLETKKSCIEIMKRDI